MALHPGSLSEAYAALQESGLGTSVMRSMCERAYYRGTDTLGRYTVTFDREAGYRVSCRELATAPAGPHADVCMARSITHGWHVEGVGTVGYVYTHLDASVTLGGPQGYRTFPLDALVEATPPAARRTVRSCASGPSASYLASLAAQYDAEVITKPARPHMITLPPLAVTKLAATLARADLGGGYALGRLFVQTAGDGSAVISLS